MDKAFGTSQTVTADMPRLGKSIDWTGATWTTALTWAHTINLTLYGSLTLISGLTHTSGSAVIFMGRSSYTLKSFGISFAGQVVINAPTGTIQLLDDFVDTNASQFSLTNGTFDANNNGVKVYQFIASAGTTILMGSGTWEITAPNNNNWNFSATANVTAGTSTIKFTDSSNSVMSFGGGGKIYNNIWFSRGASTGSITITGSNTFNDFKDDGTAAHSILFTAASTQTFTTFTVSGTAGNLITLNSTTTGIFTLTAPSRSNASPVSSAYLNIQHSVVVQANTWYAGVNSTNNQGDVTAGSGWIFADSPSSYISVSDNITDTDVVTVLIPNSLKSCSFPIYYGAQGIRE
jgi:hypothetical protein